MLSERLCCAYCITLDYEAIIIIFINYFILFYISGQYRAEVADTAVCTPDFAVLPSALSGSPH